VHGEDENTFLSGGSEGIVIKWNILQPDKATAVARVDGQVFSLLLIPEKNHLVVGTMSGGLHVVDLSLKKEIHYITYHQQSIFDIQLHDQELFVASKDGVLSVWSPDDYKLERSLTLSNASLRMISFHPGAREAAIGCSDNRIYLLDLTTWKTMAILEGPDNSVFSVQYNPDGDYLLAGSRDARLYIFDMKSHRLMKQINAHMYTINHILYIAENKFFATASRDKTVRIWDAATFELVKSIDKAKSDGHTHSVNRLLWMESLSYLVAGSDDRSITVWKITET
jgi:WD40 repeat protein